MEDRYYFNPRAPCGARRGPGNNYRFHPRFQSTRPLRGATLVRPVSFFISIYFNPRAPCGARRSDTVMDPSGILFQSTRPLRGATRWPRQSLLGRSISIHAPLAGRDMPPGWQVQSRHNFNPRAPCGARLLRSASLSRSILFQSTRPLRGATGTSAQPSGIATFQSTRPLRGATAKVYKLLCTFLR